MYTKEEKRGRKKNVKKQTVKEQIKLLHDHIKYLKAENHFLAKLRGLKGE